MKSALSIIVVSVAIASLPVFPVAPKPAFAATSAKPTPVASSKRSDPCAAIRHQWDYFVCEYGAPGDEYFGRTKLSYMGIEREFADVYIMAGDHSADPSLASKADFATEALKQWAAKYPSDLELPRAYFLAARALRKLYIKREQDLAWRFVELLGTKYAKTTFGNQAKSEIRGGFTERWFTLAEGCPTPLPRGAMPEASPVATPTPSPAPGQPSVELITPPCVQPSPDVNEDAASSPSPRPTK